MPIHLLHEKATPAQVAEMLLAHQVMIKFVVDLRRQLWAGGSSMHYECEQLLLDDGSDQDDLWGGNWLVENQAIEFESLINIRPRQGNRSMVVQDPALQKAIETLTRAYLEGVQP